MPHLVIEQPGIPPMTVQITAAVTSFGRAEENTIVLLADEISRFHAKIRLQGGQTILDDLKSMNGTYVNRQRVTERVLADKDEVWFGSKCRASFHDDPEEVKKQAKTESTLTLSVDRIREEMDSVTASMTMIAPSRSAQAAQIADVETGKMQRAFRRLNALYKATQLIASDFDVQKRVTHVLDLAMEVTHADRGFLMMNEEGSEELLVKVAREMGHELSSSSPSMGVAQLAALNGEPLLMADSGSDARFSGRESIIAQKITSAMCVPLKVENRILGAIYVDSQKSGMQFTEEDLELLQTLANQSAMAIENVHLYEKMLEAERKRANFSRFLSPAVVEHLMSEDQDVTLGGEKRPVTIMFCDIRGFTTLSEGLTPERLVEFLNEHFTAMTEIVFQHGGTLDKFIGDEVMALFGAPFTSQNDGVQAVRAGLAMQAKNRVLNEGRKERGFPPFEIGIGINTGEVFTGYIGSPERLDYSVIGDHVNIAARLCSVAGPGQVIIGQQTYEAIEDIIDVRSAGTPTLKGKSKLVKAYEVLGFKASEPPTTPGPS